MADLTADLARFKPTLTRAVGAIDPHPTLFLLKVDTGLELVLRDRDEREVRLAFAPASEAPGEVHRTAITALDVIEGTLDAAYDPWIAAMVGCLPELEAQRAWSRFLRRAHRRASRG